MLMIKDRHTMGFPWLDSLDGHMGRMRGLAGFS